jgi:hypothetical protein
MLVDEIVAALRARANAPNLSPKRSFDRHAVVNALPWYVRSGDQDRK